LQTRKNNIFVTQKSTEFLPTNNQIQIPQPTEIEEVFPKNYDKTTGSNPKIFIPSNKPTTNISVWVGIY